MKRTFIAIKIPLSAQAVELINTIKFALKDESIKWVENWNLHITLFFIGDTYEEDINEIGKKLMKSLEKVKSFNLECEGFGVFKNVFNPKVLWIGIRESEGLNILKLEVNKVMSAFGLLTEEKYFKPHLTLGRMKFGKDKNKIKMLIEKYKDVKFQNLVIDQVLFYESILTSEGPTYKVLREFLLS